MTTLAVVEPTTLLGEELRRVLDRRPEPWSRIELLTTDSEQQGALTEQRGRAALVKPYAAAELAGVEVVAVCGGDPERVRADAGDSAAVVAIGDGVTPAGGQPLVAGVNLERLDRSRLLVSPPAPVVQMALLVAPLAAFEPRAAVAVAIEPVSTVGREALEELLDQTRSLLAFKTEVPTARLGAQLAFNLLPGAERRHAEAVREVLGAEIEIAIETVRAPVYHGLAMALRLRCARPVEVEAVRQALTASPWIELADDPERLGPIDGANDERLLVGSVRPDPAVPGAFWIWSVMDNLTRGAALNAAEILEALAGAPSA